MFPRENGVFYWAGVTQLVECDLAKVDVAGSNPVSRSKIRLLRSQELITMNKRFVLLAVTAFSAFAQDYQLEPVTAAAPGLPAAYAAIIQSQGFRVAGPAGPWCELWFAKAIPVGAKPGDDAISFGVAQGALLGVLRFPGKGADRRGQVIPAGIYTMRYSNFPVDGAHSGVAPQRDFALLTPVANDADPASKPAFDELMKMSVKASGTPHPAVFSLETPPSGATVPSIGKEGEHDWSLTVKVGDLTFSIILVGKADG